MDTITKFGIFLDLKTHVNEKIDDLFVELSFVPQIGMNIYLDEEHIKFSEFGLESDWFRVVEVDYQLKDHVFIISLGKTDEYKLNAN